MRKDMFKVIVERPRLGHADRARPGRARPLQDADGEPLRARVTDAAKPLKTKHLNENLAPLKRYLDKQVGRPWNKVYAEICENLKTGSTVQQHVRDHLDDFVARVCRMQDGAVMASARWGGEKPVSQDWRAFYVHPRTGLLRRNEARRSWPRRRKEREAADAAERATRMRVLDEQTQLHRLKDDVWWEVKLAKIKRHKTADARGRAVYFDEPYTDVVMRAGLSELCGEALYGRPGVYAAAKRQLGKAEKKKLGLS